MQLRTIAALCALLSLLVGLVGCTMAETTPELLHVIDVVPREAELGDRMEVIGAGFPEGRPAKVVFQGTLWKPGQRPTKRFEIAVDAVSTSGNRVELTVTESLRGAFCGHGDRAIHTTFEGNILVAFPGAPGTLPVTGSVRNVRLDFRPAAQRQAVIKERESEGDRALALMGISVARDVPASGGLLVTEVRAGSAADQVGIFPGDLITSFDGVRVFDRSDISPSGTSRFASVGLVRGAGATSQATSREVVRAISIQGWKQSASSDLLVAGLLLLLTAASVLLFGKPLGSLLTWLERRIASLLQSQRPQRGLARLLPGIRSVLRKDVFFATGNDEPLSAIAPYLVFLGISAIFVVMPFGQHIVAADLDIGILFVLAVTLLVTMGLLAGGWSPRSEWSWRSGLRAAGQIVSFELPGGIAIACVVMMTGSLRASDIVLAQGGWPWQWFVFQSPISFGLFGLWLSTSLLEGGRPSNALPEAESPPTAQKAHQPSGMRYLFFFFAEWGNVFVMCGLASVLFLGGWQLPGTAPLEQESSFWLQALGAFWFQLKSWTLIFFVVGARATLPRVRMAQMLRVCWRYLVPATFASFLLTALWMLWSPPEAVETLVALGTFALFLITVGYLVLRLRQDSRTTGGQVQLNPLL